MTLSLERLRELHQTQQTLDGDLDEMDLDAALRELIAIRETASRAPETPEAVAAEFDFGHDIDCGSETKFSADGPCAESCPQRKAIAALQREREIAAVRLADVRITPSKLREKMDAAFSAATANNPFTYRGGSHGHCAVAAIIVRAMLGGEFVSATVNGQSHWFNRLGDVDIDITGDQFGLAPVRSAPVGTLHEGTLIRAIDALTKETIERAGRLLLAVNGLAK